MKFFSYRLSTLLLVYLTAGAFLGLFLAGGVWKRAGTLRLDEKNVAVGLLEFDRTAGHLLAYNGENLYLFDLETKHKIWKQPFLINPGMDVEMRFIRRGEAVEMEVTQAGSQESFYYATADGGQRSFVYADPRDKPARHSLNSDVYSDPAGELSEYARVEDHSVCISYKNWLDESFENCVFDAENLSYSLRFSPDGQYLATGHDGCVTVWRRTRGYGPLGMIALPIYWIAAALLIVIVIKVQRFKPIE